MTRERLRSFLVSHPSSSLVLLAVLARRIRETDRLLMNRVTRNLNAQVDHEMSLVQRLASRIANGTGGLPFLFLNICAFSCWILINIGAIPGIQPFDPYPFDLLTLAVSLEAILLSILVLLAQNLQSTKDRLRGEIEYEVNLKAELEIAELLGKLDHLHTELVRALREVNAR